MQSRWKFEFVKKTLTTPAKQMQTFCRTSQQDNNNIFCSTVVKCKATPTHHSTNNRLSLGRIARSRKVVGKSSNALALQEFFQEWKRQGIVNPCQVADDAMQMSVHETLYPFYTTPQRKKMPLVAIPVTKMAFIRSHSQVYYDNFHNRLSADFQSKVLLFTDKVP